MMNSKLRGALIYLSTFLLISTASLSAHSQSIEEGEELYKANCTACHQIDGKLIGPALRNVGDKYSEEWLIKWIKNSAEMIASGDPDAIAIYEEYNKSPMTAFPYFSDDDVRSILAYIEQAPEKSQATVSTSDGVIETGESSNNDYIILTISIILLLFVYALWKAKNMLKVAANENPKDLFQSISSILTSFIERKPLVVFTVVLLAVGGANAAWNIMTGIGVYQNYAPEQPIKFSHKLHAGENGVDCNYCHTSARHSKHSSIPSASLCMNCHTYIKEGPSGKEEIQKIYDAVGFDPEKGPIH